MGPVWRKWIEELVFFLALISLVSVSVGWVP